MLFCELFCLQLPLRLFIACVLCSHSSLAVRLKSCLLGYLRAQENCWWGDVGAEVLLGECPPWHTKVPRSPCVWGISPGQFNPPKRPLLSDVPLVVKSETCSDQLWEEQGSQPFRKYVPETREELRSSRVAYSDPAKASSLPGPNPIPCLILQVGLSMSPMGKSAGPQCWLL